MSNNPTRWVRADHLMQVRRQLTELQKQTAALLAELAAADCFEIQSTKLIQRASRPHALAVEAEPLQDEDEPTALTKAQIHEAGKTRHLLSRMPDWLPERIRPEDHRAIIRVAIDRAHQQSQPSQPAQPAAPQRRQSFKQCLGEMREAHGKQHTDWIVSQRLGANRTTFTLRKLFAGFLGTFEDNTAAGFAFARENKIHAESPGQALEALARAKHRLEQKDGTVSVWAEHVAPGAVAHDQTEA